MLYTLEFGILLGLIFSVATAFYVLICINTYGDIKEQELKAKVKLLTKHVRVKKENHRVISINDMRDVADEQVQDARQKVRQVGVVDL